MSNLDKKINALKNGESIEISRTELGFVTVERSGDGQTLRFIRHTGNTSTVFHSCKF